MALVKTSIQLHQIVILIPPLTLVSSSRLRARADSQAIGDHIRSPDVSRSQMTVEATNNGWRSGWSSRTCLPKLCVFNEFKNTNFKVELPMINEKQTMKALVYNGPGVKILEQRPIPKLLAPTDAIVKISKTTICGTDLHIQGRCCHLRARPNPWTRRYRSSGKASVPESLPFTKATEC